VQPQNRPRRESDCEEDDHSLPDDRYMSSMRWFLDTNAAFEWPPDVGLSSGNHCHLKPLSFIPLVWRRRISDKKASIDEYQCEPRYRFRRLFVVKTIHKSHYNEKVAQEAQTMRDIRHPHCVVLLGTFTFHDGLTLIIFPAARCDLFQFMKATSRELASDFNLGFKLGGTVKKPDNVDPAGSSSDLDQPKNEPLKHHLILFSFLESINILRRCFVCLSQGLAYLHASDIRHNDIKPENILMDWSGYVLLADFGISRNFSGSAHGKSGSEIPLKTTWSPTKAERTEDQRSLDRASISHVTNDQWEFTRKYVSPEMMKDRRNPRSDASAIFSLGCVFLEIATLVIGRNLSTLAAYIQFHQQGHKLDPSYFCNLGVVYKWIQTLELDN
jgi:serine/threonine protein kinase